MITAPITGYNTAEKRDYREKVWAALASGLTIDRRKATVLILPHTAGLEIPLLLNLGFSEANILAVDKDPALFETAPWVKRYPKVQKLDFDVGAAFRVLARGKEKVDLANIDLCSQLCPAYARLVEFIRDSGVLKSGSRIAFTMQNGREQKKKLTRLYPQEIAAADDDPCWRRGFIAHLLAHRYKVKTLTMGHYANSRKPSQTTPGKRHRKKGAPMIWSALEVVS